MLTCGAFIPLVAEATVPEHPPPPSAAALVFPLLTTVGYGWVHRQEPPRPLRLAVLYFVVALSFLVFALGAPGVGSTLLLLVLVSQSLLPPLPAAVVVTAVVPMVHLGMPVAEGCASCSARTSPQGSSRS